jgi:hypothetical protein
MEGTFTDILAKMDAGWQDRQGTSVTLDGRGFEWGRDWRIWCANLKQANRYRGVVVEVLHLLLLSDTYRVLGSVFTFDVSSVVKTITYRLR